MQDISPEWGRRWSTLRAVVDDTLESVPLAQAGIKRDVGSVDRAEDIRLLLDYLRDFSGELIRFFSNPENQTGFKAQAAIAATLKQVGHDIGVMRQLISQRSSPALAGRLRTADRLITKALAPAVKARLFTEAVKDDASSKYQEHPITPVPLAYFHKSPVIRVIPYANIALIAIPFTAMREGSVDQDLLAIGHEVGHYVWWNAKTPLLLARQGYVSNTYYANAAERRLKDAGFPAWARKWAEEAFADVYGTRVHGPMSALSFQDLQFGHDYDFTRDGGVHPTPLLRPEGHARTLEDMDLHRWAAALGARWTQKRDDWLGDGVQADALAIADDDGSAVTLGAGRDAYLGMVDELNALLPKEVTCDANGLARAFPEVPDPNSKDLDQQLGKLYVLWEGEVAGGLGLGEEAKLHWSTDRFDAWLDELVEQDVHAFPLRYGESEKDRRWKVALVAGGWTTEEPQSTPPQ